MKSPTVTHYLAFAFDDRRAGTREATAPDRAVPVETEEDRMRAEVLTQDQQEAGSQRALHLMESQLKSTTQDDLLATVALYASMGWPVEEMTSALNSDADRRFRAALDRKS